MDDRYISRDHVYDIDTVVQSVGNWSVVRDRDKSCFSSEDDMGEATRMEKNLMVVRVNL